MKVYILFIAILAMIQSSSFFGENERNIASLVSNKGCVSLFAHISKWVLDEDIINAMKSLPYKKSNQSLGGHATDATVLVYGDAEGSMKVVFKRQLKEGSDRAFRLSNSKAEVLAYELDRILGIGLVPPTTILDDVGAERYWGSAQLYIDDAISAGELALRWSELAKEGVALEDLHKLSFFDFLINNRDRDVSSVLVGKNYQLFAIDHGASFTDSVGIKFKPFGFRKWAIDSFLSTDEGTRILDQLRSLDRRTFKKFLMEYIPEEQAEKFFIRIDFLVKWSSGEVKQEARDILKKFKNYQLEDLNQIVVGFFDHHNYREMTELIEVSQNNQVIMDIFANVIDFECQKRKYGLYRFTQELDLSDKAQDAIQEYLRFANHRDL